MLLMADELTNAIRAEFFVYSFNFSSKSNGHLWASLEALSMGVGGGENTFWVQELVDQNSSEALAGDCLLLRIT